MDESYFTANRHMPASMKPGEDFTPAMFVNDQNRRAPPPMQRPGAGDPTKALEWSPAAVGVGPAWEGDSLGRRILAWQLHWGYYA